MDRGAHKVQRAPKEALALEVVQGCQDEWDLLAQEETVV